MSTAISVEELPRKAERMLRPGWEVPEGIVLNRNGVPVGAVVPIDDYRRLHPPRPSGRTKSRKRRAAAPGQASLAYELPQDLLKVHHDLVERKFSEGLTPEEEAELERVGAELDAAGAATPLEQAARQRADEEHQRWMATMDEIIAKLRSLGRIP